MADKAEKDICFVVSPIGQAGSPERRHADWVFKGIIKPVFDAHYPEFKVERADQITEPGQINTQVIDRLLNSRVVVADLSFLNANVFYEVGIRHMVEKPIIHMQRIDEAIPFDVSIYRAIKFSLADFDHLEVAKVALHAMIGDVLKPDYVPNNPVIEARGRVKLSETATAPERIVMEDMAQMKARLGALEELLVAMPSAVRPKHVFTSALGESKQMREWLRTQGIVRQAKSLGAVVDESPYALMEIDISQLNDKETSMVISILGAYRRDDNALGFAINGSMIQVTGRLNDLEAIKDIISEVGKTTTKIK